MIEYLSKSSHNQSLKMLVNFPVQNAKTQKREF
jgi:hypothetical protein